MDHFLRNALGNSILADWLSESSNLNKIVLHREATQRLSCLRLMKRRENVVVSIPDLLLSEAEKTDL
jgi:hypothetical protein